MIAPRKCSSFHLEHNTDRLTHIIERVVTLKLNYDSCCREKQKNNELRFAARNFFVIRYFYCCLQEEDTKAVKLTSRERRFIRFASVEYDGQLYMTPQDFLESVVEAEPRRKFVRFYIYNIRRVLLFSFIGLPPARLKRKQLTTKDIESIREGTPTLSQGSPRLFRNLRDKGNYCRLHS